MIRDILLIIGILVYIAIGVFVAIKIDPYKQSTGLDDIASGILGAFWPLTLMFHWLLKK